MLTACDGSVEQQCKKTPHIIILNTSPAEECNAEICLEKVHFFSDYFMYN